MKKNINKSSVKNYKYGKNSKNIFNTKLKKIREQFLEVGSLALSYKAGSIKLAKAIYSFKCEYFDKAKGKKWLFKKPVQSKIEAFSDKVSANEKRLASTPLVQMLCGKNLKTLSHSFIFKYSAVLLYAHKQKWDEKEFNKQIAKDGGLSRIQKLYSDSKKPAPKNKSILKEKTKVEAKAKTNVTPTPKFSSDELRGYTKKAKSKLLRKTLKKQPEELVGKLYVAKVYRNGFKLLDEINIKN